MRWTPWKHDARWWSQTNTGGSYHGQRGRVGAGRTDSWLPAGTGLPMGWWEHSGAGCTTLVVLNATDFTFKWLVFCYINFTSIKTNEKMQSFQEGNFHIFRNLHSLEGPFPPSEHQGKDVAEKRVHAAFSPGEVKVPYFYRRAENHMVPWGMPDTFHWWLDPQVLAASLL